MHRSRRGLSDSDARPGRKRLAGRCAAGVEELCRIRVRGLVKSWRECVSPRGRLDRWAHCALVGERKCLGADRVVMGWCECRWIKLGERKQHVTSVGSRPGWSKLAATEMILVQPRRLVVTVGIQWVPALEEMSKARQGQDSAGSAWATAPKVNDVFGATPLWLDKSTLLGLIDRSPFSRPDEGDAV